MEINAFIKNSSLDSSIKVRLNLGARCELTSLTYLNNNFLWQKIDANWLKFGWNQTEAVIFVNIKIK